MSTDTPEIYSTATGAKIDQHKRCGELERENARLREELAEAKQQLLIQTQAALCLGRVVNDMDADRLFFRDKADQAEARALANEKTKDGAYLERNQVVQALSKCFPSGVAKTAIEGWSEDWHGCVYIDLPTGQVSWHFHDSQAYLFAHLPPYQGAWDGHDTPEKYRRLAAMLDQFERDQGSAT